jgi:hypothetical protein
MNAVGKMPRAERRPVMDSVAQVDREVAVGEDLDFQRRWWRFERAIWLLFVVILALDLAGAFGRGPLAHAELRTPDGELRVEYERIERNGTPSMMTITLGPHSSANGTATLSLSDSVVSGLGTQRVIPQPATTVVGHDGLTYTFPVNGSPAIIRLQLQPSAAGIYSFSVGVPGETPLAARVVVAP